jgi:L-asparaginase II
VLQVQVRAAVAEHAGLTPEQLLVGVDGCSAPNFALPLQALARAFAELACASDTAPLGRARDAALQHPHLASGHEQFDCTLMQASAGRVFCKGGAEAIMALALPAQGLGVVLKVHDGGARAIPPATLAVLQQLGVFPDGIPSALKVYQRPQLRNASGLATGELIADVPIA